MELQDHQTHLQNLVNQQIHYQMRLKQKNSTFESTRCD